MTSVYRVTTWVGEAGREHVVRWLAEWTNKALKYAHGETSPEDMVKAFQEGRMQVWAVFDDAKLVGVATTEVVDYPRLAVLRVVTLQGSNLSVWASHLLEALLTFCKEQGLERIEVVGRRGWVRKLAPLGFREIYSVVAREVEGVQVGRDNANGIEKQPA